MRSGETIFLPPKPKQFKLAMISASFIVFLFKMATIFSEIIEYWFPVFVEIGSCLFHSLTILFFAVVLPILLIPSVVALAVISVGLFPSLTTSSGLDKATERRLLAVTADVGPWNTKIQDVFVLQFIRRPRNEYCLNSVIGPYPLSSLLPAITLKAILNTYLRPYTTTVIDHVLVIMPTLESLLSLRNQSDNSTFRPLEHRKLIPNMNPALQDHNLINCSSESGGQLFPSKLSYFDVSMERYGHTAQSFYKEKRPMHFKFLK